MGVWNNNDREESKPQFLNKTEKRHVVRTIRGWEMPQMGSQFAYGLTNGNYGSAVGLTNAIVLTELIVSLPNDPSITGATSSNYAYGFTGPLTGLTFGSDIQDLPYFSAPSLGDGGITGATAFNTGASGVSHSFITYCSGFDSNGYPLAWGSVAGATPGVNIGYQYGVNAYGVSTLSGLTGVTAYIKVQANDTNLSQSLTLSLSGNYDGITFATGIGLTAGGSIVAGKTIPWDVYKTFFGPTGDKNGRIAYRQDNIGVLIVGGQTAWGQRIISMNVRDSSGSTAPFGSVGGPSGAGATNGTNFTLIFDRSAGLTTGGGTTPTLGQYFWTNTSTIRI
jgi:hypothetical protein